MKTFETLESNVRHYSRRWPVVFTRAGGTSIRDEGGTRYLDFFAGAGSLNYGHNPGALIAGMITHLRSGGLINALDTATVAKRAFLTALSETILQPRGLTYRVQFTGPTGTNAVEAALRLARKVTGRRRIVAVTGGYHGMTLDSISVSDLPAPAGLPTLDAGEVTRVPHEADAGSTEPARARSTEPALARSTETALAALRAALCGAVDPPAALLLETVQGEGGSRALSTSYLKAAEQLCRAAGAVLIVDDIQAGCGRTGRFFSFEEAGLHPGLVCLSKSLSGIGLPLSVVLIAPELDAWSPGEHTGTFRGNELALVTARIALERWWTDGALQRRVSDRSATLLAALRELASQVAWLGPPTGRGLLLGLPCGSRDNADQLAELAFRRGLIVETCGRHGDVLKICPPLIVTEDEIDRAVGILRDAVPVVRPTVRPPVRPPVPPGAARPDSVPPGNDPVREAS